jgi:23S rRNA pseudouridine2604 synthase
MTESERLSKRVAELARCSRADADLYIAGGWVSVDGKVIEAPQHPVTDECIEIDPAAVLEAPEPATLLLHKPAGIDSVDVKSAAALVTPTLRWAEDPSGIRLLQNHFIRLTPLVPLDREASGLMVLTQNGRVWRRLTEDADQIEQEYIVEVSGEIAPYGLRRLNHGLSYRGRELPPCKVSWQNEFRLRFAIRAAQPGQIRDMCAQVKLQVTAMRRLRIGRVSLAKLPVGEWRYLPVGEKF